jgi:hypothetical protein
LKGWCGWSLVVVHFLEYRVVKPVDESIYLAGSGGNPCPVAMEDLPYSGLGSRCA